MSESKKPVLCYNLSNEILDKLYILDYDKTFLQQNSMKPLIPDYFATSLNPHEQFTTFKNLVKWLLSLNDIDAVEFDTYDDPNTVAQNIQLQLKNINLSIEVRANSIKQGKGKHICDILLALINRTLKTKRIRLGKPEFPANDNTGRQEMDIMEDDEIEDYGYVGNYVNEDDEEELGIADTIDQDKKVIESKASTREWRLECNKVKGKLELRNPIDQKEWRQHIEKAKVFSTNLETIKPSIQSYLEKLSDKLGHELEVIMSRETAINKAMNDFGEEFKEKSDRYKYLQDRIDHLTSRVKTLNDEYTNLSVKNEQIQTKLQEQGNSATNDEPLIRLKKALSDITIEIKSMDVRIGVLNNIVWKHSFETKRQQIDNTLIGNRAVAADSYNNLYNIAETNEDMDDLNEDDEEY